MLFYLLSQPYFMVLLMFFLFQYLFFFFHSFILFICNVFFSTSFHITFYCDAGSIKKKQQTKHFYITVALFTGTHILLYSMCYSWSIRSSNIRDYHMLYIYVEVSVSDCFFQYRKCDPGFCHFYALSIYLSLCLLLQHFYHSVCMLCYILSDVILVVVATAALAISCLYF